MNKIYNDKYIEKNGYRFMGWYIDPEFTKRINPGGILPKVLTLYDKWLPIVYPVRYQMNGGMNSRRNPKQITVESEDIPLLPARKKNKKFSTWLLNGQPVNHLPAGTQGPVELTALFSDLDIVHFETYGGGNVKDKEVGLDLKIDPFPNPMKMGCTFAGWFWDSEFKWEFTFDQEIKQTCTLYAKWKINHFDITYDCDGGITSRQNPKTYTYFDEDILLLPASKPGYTFVGWFDSWGNKAEKISQNTLGNLCFKARYQEG